jgi:DNA-binding response OmpR family regulator
MSNTYAIIADADRAFGGALRVQLDAVGFISFIATDAQEVLGHVMQFVPALIMLDVRLPGLGAYQACLHVRRLPGCSALPIMLMASSNQWQIAAAARRAGASALLVKPFSINDLMQRLDSMHTPIAQTEKRPASTAVTWLPGVAEPPAPVWAPPVRSGAAETPPSLSLGIQMLDVMRRREAKRDKP